MNYFAVSIAMQVKSEVANYALIEINVYFDIKQP